MLQKETVRKLDQQLRRLKLLQTACLQRRLVERIMVELRKLIQRLLSRLFLLGSPVQRMVTSSVFSGRMKHSL